MRTRILESTSIGAIALAIAASPGRADALYFNTDLLLDNTVVQVCWEPVDPSISIPNLETRREWVRRAVERSWSRYAPVSFVEWDECDGSYSHVRIQITDSGACNASGATWNPNVEHGLVLNLDDTRFWIEANAIHEFGHVLGFYHEEERLDYSGPLPFADGNGNGIRDIFEDDCDPQDWSTEVPPPSWRPQVQPMEYLGRYDVHSAMSYCGRSDNISAGDVAGVQHAYGIRVGNLVSTRGYSLFNLFGDVPVMAQVSDHTSYYDWHAEPASETGFVFEHRFEGSDRCLDVAHPYYGANAELGSCYSGTAEWQLERVAVRGWGGLCLASPGGAAANGTAVRMETCTGGTNQQWSVRPNGEIRYGGLWGSKCLTGFLGDVFLHDCNYPAFQRFVMADGEIRLGSRCMDVVGWTDAQYTSGNGLPFSGEDVQMFTCLDEQVNQQWFVSGHLTNAQTGYCLGRWDEDDQLSEAPVARTCSGSDTGTWDYVF